MLKSNKYILLWGDACVHISAQSNFFSGETVRKRFLLVFILYKETNLSVGLKKKTGTSLNEQVCMGRKQDSPIKFV